MKRAFIFIGSRQAEKSNSKQVIDLIINQLNKYSDEKIVYNIYYPNSININNCLGCNTCFEKGFCLLDKKDNFNLVKDKILESDLIIFVSPVYAHNITGDMKVFIDRISSWFHIFKLAGKKSVVISVSSTNGNEYVNGYLRKVLEIAGTEVISNISVTIDGPCMLKDEEFLQEVLPKICKRIIKSLNSDKFNTSREQEKYFVSMRDIYKNTIEEYKDKSFEYLYWKDKKMLESESLKDYVDFHKSKLIDKE